jgi:hypothetical protein
MNTTEANPTLTHIHTPLPAIFFAPSAVPLLHPTYVFVEDDPGMTSSFVLVCIAGSLA